MCTAVNGPRCLLERVLVIHFLWKRQFPPSYRYILTKSTSQRFILLSDSANLRTTNYTIIKEYYFCVVNFIVELPYAKSIALSFYHSTRQTGFSEIRRLVTILARDALNKSVLLHCASATSTFYFMREGRILRTSG